MPLIHPLALSLSPSLWTVCVILNQLKKKKKKQDFTEASMSENVPFPHIPRLAVSPGKPGAHAGRCWHGGSRGGPSRRLQRGFQDNRTCVVSMVALPLAGTLNTW